MGQNEGKALDIEIVGLVQNAKYSEVKDSIPPLFFIRIVKTSASAGSATTCAHRLRPSSCCRRFSLSSPSSIRICRSKICERCRSRSTRTFSRSHDQHVLGRFRRLATLLAAVGLYGVLAYTVAQRTREIGLRLALGANRGNVRRMVLTQVVWMTMIGGTAGLAGAIGLGRAAKSLLFELEGHDPAVLAAAAVMLTLVALGAGFIPAQRASKIDPMRALRYE